MPLSLREWRELHEIGRTVRRSDPRLSALLDIFCRLAVGDTMPAHERLPARAAGLVAAVRLLGIAAARVITRAAAAVTRLAGRIRWRSVSAAARPPARYRRGRARSPGGLPASGRRAARPDSFQS